MANVTTIAPIQIKNNPILPVIDQARISGGMGWVVADIAARDIIPTEARQAFMEVKVIDAGGPTNTIHLESGLVMEIGQRLF